MSVDRDEKYMDLALLEAKKGLGRTSPNPCVGSVIVSGDTIVGRGYHKKAGTPHAEIHALRQAAEKARGSTLYVTLEPCSHTGRTPPCCEAIAESGIQRVVVGMIDPNPLVAGNGIRYLQSHGVEVSSPVLEHRCVRINQPFIKHITTVTPWVAMKAGISLDGRISYQKGIPGRITGKDSSKRVHQLRDRFDGILVGIGTVIADNPSLTTRLNHDGDKDPIRIVLDTDLKIAQSAKMLHLESSSPTWIFCSLDVSAKKISALQSVNTSVFQVKINSDGHVDLQEVLRILGKQEVTSLLVEGGGGIHGSFLREELFDYAYLFYAPIFAGDSGSEFIRHLNVNDRKQAIRMTDVKYERMGEDMLVEGEIAYSRHES